MRDVKRILEMMRRFHSEGDRVNTLYCCVSTSVSSLSLYAKGCQRNCFIFDMCCLLMHTFVCKKCEHSRSNYSLVDTHPLQGKRLNMTFFFNGLAYNSYLHIYLHTGKYYIDNVGQCLNVLH